METLLVSAIMWQEILLPGSEPTPAFPTAREQRIRRTKNPNYFPARETEEEANRKLFESLSHPTLPRENLDAKAVLPVPNRTTLVIAPHPDDEILCCSRLMADRAANSENVKIMVITDGGALADTTFEKALAYADWRKQESLTAAKLLGLEDEDIFFLGFPDGELHRVEKEGSVRSRFTDRIASSRSSYFPGTPYTREGLKKNIHVLLNRLQPTEIYIPSQTLDSHPDHRVTEKLALEVLASQDKISPEIFEYVVHGRQFSSKEIGTVNEQKLKLIQVFRSQFWTKFHRNFMEQFAAVPERFARVIKNLAKAR